MNSIGNENELQNANNYVDIFQISRHKWKPITEVPAIFFAKVGAAVMLNRKRLVQYPFLLDNNTMAYSFEKGIWNISFGKSLFETIDLTSLVQVGALPSYNASDVEDIKIFLPSLPEQARIGTFFRQLDRLITLHQCNCNMATRPCEWSSGLRAIAWEQRKLGEVAKLNNGKDYKHLGDGNIPVYGTGGYMLSVNQALSYKDDAIGIGRKGTIDKPYILKAPFWTVDTLFYSIPNDKTELNFLFATFQKVDWKAADESTGVSSLSKSTIENIITFFPSLPEQARIGAFFCHLDRLITLHQRKYILLT